MKKRNNITLIVILCIAAMMSGGILILIKNAPKDTKEVIKNTEPKEQVDVLCLRPNTITKEQKTGRLFEFPIDSITTSTYTFTMACPLIGESYKIEVKR